MISFIYNETILFIYLINYLRNLTDGFVMISIVTALTKNVLVMLQQQLKNIIVNLPYS